MKVISQKDAETAGLKRFFTGLPCKHGHVAERLVRNRDCYACSQARQKKWSHKNPEYWKHWYARNIEQERAKNREKQKRYYSTNPEPRKARARSWYQNNITLVLTNAAARRSKNRIQFNANARAYYHANRDACRAQNKAWFAANRDRAVAAIQRRRARKKSAEGNYSAEDVTLIRRLQSDRCAVCKTSLNDKGTVDHIVPLIRGGTNWPRNLQLLCLSCNSSKGTKDPMEYSRLRGLLL